MLRHSCINLNVEAAIKLISWLIKSVRSSFSAWRHQLFTMSASSKRHLHRLTHTKPYFKTWHRIFPHTRCYFCYFPLQIWNGLFSKMIMPRLTVVGPSWIAGATNSLLKLYKLRLLNANSGINLEINRCYLELWNSVYWFLVMEMR